MKKALVIRLGAFGDVIQITPVFRELKKQGYHVTFYCKKYGKETVIHDSNIDNFIIHDDSIPIGELNKYLSEKIHPGYDRVVNLSSIVEKGLLKLEGSPEFNWSHDMRHRAFNKNYSDALMEAAGLEVRGQNPELYFSRLEESLAKQYIKKFRDKFVIMWSLSGSSLHKVYPYSEYVASALYKHSDIEVLTVGDELCEMLEWHNDKTHNYSGKWTFRKSMIIAKYCDLVIGPETGILNAASAYDVPKIIMLSHSSEENLTKYWKNCVNLFADVHCYPCHCLNKTMVGCDKEPGLNSPVCMSRIHSKQVYLAIMKYYNEWREKKWRLYLEGKRHSTRKAVGSIPTAASV
jgi:ADP-heptose:LPS heptosyltransferase